MPEPTAVFRILIHGSLEDVWNEITRTDEPIACFFNSRMDVRALHPGGLLVLNLPAYDWLYSEHDVAIHTAERYTARRVSQLLDSIGLDVEWLSYRLCGLFPLVVASRLPSLVRARPGDAEARSALHRESGAALNQILYGVLRAENALIVRGIRLPFGSSVFAVGRKP